MDKHKCKLCFKSFSNGRALGGHMRSHMLNLTIPPKPKQVEEEEEEEEEDDDDDEEDVNQVSDDAESASSSSSSSSDEDDEEGGEDKGQFYGLRENPKRSVRLGDPEFSFAPVDAASVVLQDRESETESSKNPTRRRSKRTWKSEYHHHHRFQQNAKKFKSCRSSTTKSESWAEPEPVSSISGTTTEEDVAFCLMMLSRDNKWKKRVEEDEDQQRGEAEKSMEETDESYGYKSIKTPTSRGKYKCETCNKVFKSYQALGGHRASHKKIKASNEPQSEQENVAGTCSSMAEKKIHECPVCLRIFSSGQALGGHKRSHGMGLVEAPAKSCTSFIDLNLPAPVDDEELSQIEVSAVSDAEFVNQMKQ